MIWKSTFREIRQSMGRFLAILAIIALGVGLFAGLKVTKPSMLKTAEHYLTQKGFYDYRLLSTLGFEQEEVDFLAQKEDVQSAEGAVSFDILYVDEAGNEAVARAHSLMDQINGLEVLEGRMPQAADECVVDSHCFDKSVVGQKLALSENNAEEDLEHFAYREYTIVGVAQSSYYIQYERGNTSLGTGKINGFIYLPYDGFDVDYYTEIFVKFQDNFPLYSEEYDAYMEDREVVWEAYADQAADMRYQRIVADAEGELADAREEYETGKADGERELADAREELADAAQQLSDGERELADAREELEDARRTVAEKEQELADAEQEIADAEQEIADGEQELQDGVDQWNIGKYQLDQAKIELQSAMDQLAEQKSALEQKEQELQEGEAALNESEAALQQQMQELSAQSQALEQQEQQLTALYGEGNVPEETAAPIREAKEQLAAGQSQLEAGLSQLAGKRQELEEGRAALVQGEETVGAYEQQLAEGEKKTKDGDQSLADSWKELEAGRQELEDARAQLADARVQLEDGRAQLADARREIADGERTLAEKEQELADAKAEYGDGLQEYEDGVREFDEEIADAEMKLADAEQEVRDIEEPESYLLGRDTNVGYVCFDSDTSIAAGIANIFPVFFFLVAALVCVTTMNRMVEEQRTQIGVLKALGYSDGVIMSKYMFYSGSAALIGCVAGFAGGTWLFPRVIWEAYGIMYNMEELAYVFDWKLAVISIVVSLLCSVGTTWLSCRVELGRVAAQLMRPKSPRAGKRVFLEYLPFLWKRMGFLRKVSIRNIFRYRKRLFMMVMGISGCTALLVAAFGIEDSIADVGDQQFAEIQLYDLDVAYSEAVSGEDLAALKADASVEEGQYLPLCETTFDLVTDAGRKSVNVLVFDEETQLSPFIDLHTTKGEPIAFPGEGEVVINHKIAENYGLEVGDTITLQNEDMEEITARVSGINQNFIYNYAYINSGTYAEQLGREAEYKNVFVNLAPEADTHRISAALMKEDNVATVSVNQDILSRFSSMMTSVDLIVVVVVLCAACLAFIVLYNLTNINITERVREIATIKVLGFRKKETASYVFRENMMLAVMGIAVGLLLGHFLHRFIMDAINIDMMAFDIRVRPVSYCYSVLLTFVFTWVVNRIMSRKLERISMTESLKSVD